MSIIHTIKIQNERFMNGTVSSTRKSDTKRYQACVVATITAESVRLDRAAKAKKIAELAEQRAECITLEAKYGTTAAEAKAWHETVASRWYDGSGKKNDDGILGTQHRIEKERNLTWRDRNECEKLAKEDMIKRGFEEPFVKGGKYDLVETANRIEYNEDVLERWNDMVLGQEGVLTWCGSVGLAEKALSNRDCTFFANLGHKLTVRTDITTRETAKKAPKA